MGDTMKKVVIDDGTREIPIVNQFDQPICKIYMRPADLSILDRYETVMKDLPNVVKPLEALSIEANGEATYEADRAIMKKVEEDLYDRINALFDIEEAEQIFAKRNPFSSVGGEFFVIRVLQAIGDVIKDAMETEFALSSKRMGKYLDSDDRETSEVSDG